MTRTTFNALIKLFAISINRQKHDHTAVLAHFRSFLIDYLDSKYVESFLVLFNNYLSEFSSQESKKKLSLNSVKLIAYCTETAQVLNSQERLILIFNLCRLVNETVGLDDSVEFIKLVADIYEIPQGNLNKLIDFIRDISVKDTFSLRMDNIEFAKAIHLSMGVYALKNQSEEAFNIDTVNIRPNCFCYAISDSVIQFKDGTKTYFVNHIAEVKSNHQSSFSLHLNNLSVNKGKSAILKPITLSLESNQFIGIIGNSGSGKTTLLEAISGLNKKIEGEINLKSVNSTNLKFAYLKQDFTFIPEFTVYEHLRRRTNFLQISSKESNQLISEISSAVGLENHLNKICNKQLSGGQKKRLRIAMELLSTPDILLIDEPTSGLSSEDSVKQLSLLKQIANQNKLIISSVHKPDYESLLAFDKILVLDDGYPVFYGKPLEAGEYFRERSESVDVDTVLERTKNPSVILKLLKRNPVGYKSWYDAYSVSIKKNTIGNEKLVNLKKRNKLKLNPIKSFFNELIFTSKIEFRQKYRLVFLIAVPLICGLGFAFLSKYSSSSEYTFYENPNIAVWILIASVSSLFIGLVSSGNEMIFLHQFRLSEYYIKNKYHAQFLAAFIKYSIIAFIQTALLVLPGIYILGLEFVSQSIIIQIYLVCLSGATIGMLLSTVFKSVSVVYLIIPIFIISNLLFSGVIIKFDNFNLFKKSSTTVKLAEIYPVYLSLNSNILEIYQFEDIKSEKFKTKCLIYESNYYRNYFIPKIKDIYSKDSVLAKQVLINESTKNEQFPIKLGGILISDIVSIANYYKITYNNLISKIDEGRIEDAYVNKQIENIVGNYYKEPCVILGKEIKRQYMTAYIPPYYTSDDLIFQAFKPFFSYKLRYYNFALIRLSVLILLSLGIGLLMKVKYK